MKLTATQIKGLMTCDVYNLTQEQLKAIALVVGWQVRSYKKNDWHVRFRMSDKSCAVTIQANKNSCMSIGSNAKTSDGLSNMTSWGGTYSFAGALRVVRSVYVKGYSIQLNPPSKKYDKEEWTKIIDLAELLISTA